MNFPTNTSRLMVEQARDEGFVVYDANARGDGYGASPLCAGTLDACLAYLKARDWPLGKKDEAVA